MNDYEDMKKGRELFFQNTKYLFKENPKFKSVLPKSEYAEKYKEYLIPWEDKSAYFLGEWRSTWRLP
mgnify:CR=1 FL=1